MNIRVTDNLPLSNPQHCLIQTRSCLHADDQQIERVGKASPDFFSPFLDPDSQPHIRDQKKTAARDKDQKSVWLWMKLPQIKPEIGPRMRLAKYAFMPRGASDLPRSEAAA